jgi:hypothetical protein
VLLHHELAVYLLTDGSVDRGKRCYIVIVSQVYYIGSSSTLADCQMPNLPRIYSLQSYDEEYQLNCIILDRYAV